MNTHMVNRVSAVLGAALAVCLVAVVALLVWVSHLSNDYDPLGEYPVQHVDSKVVGRDTPSALLSSGEVVITGTKCAKAETKVRGESSWVEILPGGMVVPLGRGTAVRSAGCTTKTFRDDIPDAVAERVVSLHKRGVNESTWQVTGTETPISPDGRDGLPRSWQSQNFVIVFDGGIEDT